MVSVSENFNVARPFSDLTRHLMRRKTLSFSDSSQQPNSTLLDEKKRNTEYHEDDDTGPCFPAFIITIFLIVALIVFFLKVLWPAAVNSISSSAQHNYCLLCDPKSTFYNLNATSSALIFYRLFEAVTTEVMEAVTTEVMEVETTEVETTEAMEVATTEAMEDNVLRVLKRPLFKSLSMTDLAGKQSLQQLW